MQGALATQDPLELPPARLSFAGYEFFSLLGTGGMATVYEVRSLCGKPHDGPLAFKRLNPAWVRTPDVREMFLREGELTQRLSHPRVVQTYQTGELDGVCYIVMELVRGMDLERILQRCRELSIRLPVSFCAYLADALLEALAYAHGRGVIHCDVSPSNLFISDLGDVKLGDFGVARTAETSATARLAGKPHYVSPEFARREVSPSADLWAAAVVLYQLLTLQRPFEGPSPELVLRAIRKRRWVRPRELRPDLPPSLDELLAKAFGPEVQDRFPGAEAFRAALAPYLDAAVGTPLAIASLVRGLFRTLPPERWKADSTA